MTTVGWVKPTIPHNFTPQQTKNATSPEHKHKHKHKHKHNGGW